MCILLKLSDEYCTNLFTIYGLPRNCVNQPVPSQVFPCFNYKVCAVHSNLGSNARFGHTTPLLSSPLILASG